jgi:hypothetical protein
LPFALARLQLKFEHVYKFYSEFAAHPAIFELLREYRAAERRGGGDGGFLIQLPVAEVPKENAAKLYFEEILCACVQLVNVNKIP